MPIFEVAVSRIFIIKIEAQSDQEAAGLAPFYLDFRDSSEAPDRERFNFEFKDIKMIENEIVSVDKVKS